MPFSSKDIIGVLADGKFQNGFPPSRIYTARVRTVELNHGQRQR